MDTYNFLGTSNSGKTYLFNNFRLYFENLEKDKPFPASSFSRNLAFGTKDSKHTAIQIFQKKENYFYVFKPYEWKEYINNKCYGNKIIYDYYDLKDNFLFLVRDPRVTWFIANHYDPLFKGVQEELNKLIEEFNEFITIYKQNKNKNYFILRFEDYQNNFDYVNDELLKFFKIKMIKPIYTSSSPANYYLSDFDYYSGSKNKYFEKVLTKEILDYISNNLKEYIEIFNYKKYLYQEDILKGLLTEEWH